MPPQAPERLADVYRASDLVAVPSYSESFGLVAIEAQACGTPVIAADVGGLGVAVRNGETGLLVQGHRTEDWAGALETLNAAKRHGQLEKVLNIDDSAARWREMKRIIADVDPADKAAFRKALAKPNSDSAAPPSVPGQRESSAARSS